MQELKHDVTMEIQKIKELITQLKEDIQNEKKSKEESINLLGREHFIVKLQEESIKINECQLKYLEELIQQKLINA